MSLGTVRTELRRLAKALRVRGAIVVIPMHACQAADALEAQARAALGRDWRAADLLILSAVEGPCPSHPHQHPDQVTISPRTD
jgi:hypothetical protein